MPTCPVRVAEEDEQAGSRSRCLALVWFCDCFSEPGGEMCETGCVSRCWTKSCKGVITSLLWKHTRVHVLWWIWGYETLQWSVVSHARVILISHAMLWLFLCCLLCLFCLFLIWFSFSFFFAQSAMMSVHFMLLSGSSIFSLLCILFCFIVGFFIF